MEQIYLAIQDKFLKVKILPAKGKNFYYGSVAITSLQL
jgi:hypothetical protein